MRPCLSSLLTLVLCALTFSGAASGAQPHGLSSSVRIAQTDKVKEGTSSSTDHETPVDDLTPESKEKLSVIVPTFKGVGEVPVTDLETITGLIVYQISKVARLQVVTTADLQEMLALEAQRSSTGCSDESSCMNEIAEALGADLILAGKVGRLGPRMMIQLSLIDTARATTVAREQLQVRGINAIGVRVVEAVHALTKDFGGLPNIDAQRKEASKSLERTSYANRFIEFATQPDTVMLFVMFAGGLFALAAPVFWLAPVLQSVLLWALGDDIAGREYPRWWLAMVAGWGVYLASFIVATVTTSAGGLVSLQPNTLGLASGSGMLMGGAAASVLMVFLVEPVVAWWAGTLGAKDIALFNDVEDEPSPITEEANGATPQYAHLGHDAIGTNHHAPPPRAMSTLRVQRSVQRAAAWIGSRLP